MDHLATKNKVAVKWFTMISSHVYPVVKQGEFVSGWHAKCCRPPIHESPVETMGWSEPDLPFYPVQRDK